MEEKLVAFTFDDGPVEYAEDSSAMNILHTLEKYGQRATFFYVGQQMNEGNRKEIEFAQSLGCEAANHSFTHCFLTERTEEEIREEFAKTTKLIEEVTGKTPRLARIPYLAQNETVLAATDYPMIACSVDSRDWDHVSTEVIIERIMAAEEKGELANAVVLLHEPYRTTERAVETLIPALLEKGYRFVTVSELAEHNGIELEKHKIYEHM